MGTNPVTLLCKVRGGMYIGTENEWVFYTGLAHRD